MAHGRKSPCTIFLAPTERAELEHWQRSTTIQAGLARRAKIILLRADGPPLSEIARRLGMGRRMVRKWLQRFINKRMPGLSDKPGRGRQPVFSPHPSSPSRQASLRATGDAQPVPLPVGLHRAGPPAGTRQPRRAHLPGDGAPDTSAPQTEALHHMWLSSQTPRDAEFCARVAEVVELYTQRLRAEAMVLSLDEKTSLQPRPRRHATRPAQPGRPNQVEHEQRRAGALNLFVAFDTRTGRVYGQCYERKRQRVSLPEALPPTSSGGDLP